MYLDETRLEMGSLLFLGLPVTEKRDAASLCTSLRAGLAGWQKCPKHPVI